MIQLLAEDSITYLESANDGPRDYILVEKPAVETQVPYSRA
jgi:hypothetical protein